MKVSLRDYQAAAFDAVRSHVRSGRRRILVVSPTGSGKTVLASALMEMVREKGNRANFIVDRLSLISQSSETLFRYGLDHGVIQADHPMFRPSLPLQVCSIQTLARRKWPDSAVDLFDEAHVLHAAHKARMEAGEAITVGLTATPFTKGLGKYFDAVVNVTTTRQLITDNWLVPYRAFTCAQPDMAGVTVKSTGEWDEKEASGKALEVVGDVVAEYLKHGEGRKFICSGVDTAHVAELARQFLAAGINVATYVYTDSEDDRTDTVREFRKADSTIRGLITVTAASRGFDVPDVSCVIMARPLRKSLAEHIQLLGRGLRISPETGKTDCLVLCHSGNMARFWQKTEHFFDFGLDELDDGKPKPKEDRKPPDKEKEPMTCPQCKQLHAPAPACPSCGHEYPKKQSIQHVPGVLRELIPGATSERGAERDLFAQVAGYVAERGKDGDAARRMAQAIYRDMTGEFAKLAWDRVEPMQPSAKVRARIRSAQIRFAKGKEAAMRRAA